MTTWVLVIFMAKYSGSAPAAAITVPGFTTRDSCVAAVGFAKAREFTVDAYCVQVR